MQLFDRFLVVDWSAASRPTTGPDSIWIADLDDTAPAPTLSNPATRRGAEELIRSAIEEAEHVRSLVAIDVGLGYPSGTATTLGLRGDPWRATWERIAARLHDDDRNRNDRFDVAAELNQCTGCDEGPWWGAPDDTRRPGLHRTKPPAPALSEFRSTERTLRAAGWFPKSVWQLLGAGSVGSQTLTAIPVLHRLCSELGARIDVWPFTTQLRAPSVAPGGVVIAEIWPTQFVDETPVAVVKDAHQVAATAVALRTADRKGVLAGWFAPDVSANERAAAESEEGWVLGPPS